MKQRYSLRSNAVNLRAMALLLIALVMGGKMVYAWTPSGAGVYHLRTNANNNSRFDVYKENADGTLPSSPTASSQSQLNGFTITSGTYKFVFENTSTITMYGQIYVNATNNDTQAHLIMELGTPPNGNPANPTLKITGMNRQSGSGQDVVFFLANKNHSTAGNHTITIKGNDDPNSSTTDPTQLSFNNNFVIDGDGPSLTVVNPQSMTPQVTVGTSGAIKNYGLFRLQQGTLKLKNVTVQNFSTSWGNAGMAQVFSNTTDGALELEFDHCLFTNIGAKSATGSPVLRMQGPGGTNANKSAVLKYCRFINTFGSYELTQGETKPIDNPNATIRTLGNNRTPLTIKKCHITQNYGCPLRWHGCSSARELLVDSCMIEDNFTKIDNNQVYGGGGMLLKGPAIVTNCTIRNNHTDGSGGGIYLSTYVDFNDGTLDLVPEHSILRLDPKTEIYNNIANQNGGGVAIEAKLMRNPYHSSSYLDQTDGYIYWTANPNGSANEPFRVEFVQNGGKIYNNTANGSYGGGVYITRPKDCTFYGVECSLDSGKIVNNKVNIHAEGSGGGVAIVTTKQEETVNPPDYAFPNTVKPQNVTVEMSRATESAHKMLIQGNQANKNGGGVYVEAYPLTYHDVTSQVSTTVYDYSDIDNNTATANGGGLYVQNGSVGIYQEGTGDNAKSPTFQKNTASNDNGGGVFLNNGSVDMKGATIGGNAMALGNKAGKSGGGIYVNSGTVTMLSSDITYNKALAEDGGGVYVNAGDVLINHKEQSTGNPSEINYNKAKRDGGGIFDLAGKVVVFGAFSGDNTYRVEISHNEAETGHGGGIYCVGSGTGTEYDVRMRRVELAENIAGNDGGGIYLQHGRISIINGWLLNNTAGGGGGGVLTENGNIDINITGEERQPSKINGNKAKKNGGGLNTRSGFITVRGKSKDDRIQIIGNVAGYSPDQETNNGSGGGVFCMGGSGETEYITMRHVDLTDNMAKGDGTTVSNVTVGCGGGMYLQEGIITATDVAIQSNKADHNGGGINNHKGSIYVRGCLIGGASDKGNEAGNSGGGIYTNEGDIDIEDYVETEGSIQRIESKITYNQAAVNGGGVDTRMGTIWVNRKEMDDQIEISHNTAKKGGGLYANAGTIITYNALIHDNTATENGGGINNHAGDITLHGGILSNNIAQTGHGGGAYTFVGDIDLFQFPSTKLNDVTLNDGTKVFNNRALKNGGAFNNHTGRVDVRHATLYNNTATQGNGGAIFCEGPHSNDNRGLGYTIRLLCSDMIQNKTRGQDGTQTEPTGRGGGIYLKYGDIYAHYSNIRDNEANINGGGIDNHQGNILLYGCEVIGNRAVELDGGGIYTFKGNITTGPSTRREPPMGAKITVIENNSAYRDGGGINNQEGNIILNGDRIASNQALNCNGGGVYIANGNITMNGGKIEQNSATLGNGGGVYSGGGLFDIHEREENPDPIVLIVDSEVQRDSLAYVDNENEPQKIGIQKASIHYHLVDQGKYEGLVANSVKHGIIWYKNEGTPTEHKVYYEITEGGYTYIQGEPACQRIVIPSVHQVDAQNHLSTGTGIEANSTYKVKAFFEYQYNDGTNTITKIGYSEELEFVTYSSAPLVVSGAVSNITSTSAQGSGKIMDPGTSPITARGVQIWTGNSTPPAPSTDNLRPSVGNTDFFTVDLRKKVDEDTYINLNSNTTYYARAYATNVENPSSESDYSFGNTVEFTTLKNTPDMGSNPVIVSHTVEIVGNDTIIVITASFTMPEGTVFGTGENQVQGYGFVWSTDDDPELHTDHTTPGTLTQGTTTFTASYRGARQNICAYVRAYATYVESTVTSESDINDYSVTVPTPHYTPFINGAPVVRAINITGITQTTATITCQIFSGYENTTGYGVHVENTDTYIPSNNYSNGIYTVDLSGLTPGTTYYLKAYATYVENDVTKYSYGNGYNFTALPIVQPSVVIEAIDAITKVSADVHCSVDHGGATVTDWGVKYSTNSDMTGAINVNKPGGGDQLSGNTFIVHLDNDDHNLLTEHTTYYVQAYATNSAGTHTCQPVIFETNFDQPNVTITSIDNVDFTIVDQSQNEYIFSARGNFNVTPHSDATSDNVKTYGVCWSVLHEPTRSKSVVSNTDFADSNPMPTITGNTAVACSTSMAQTHANMKYYVRAYASTATANDDPTNGVYSLDDIQYSSESSFITLPVMFTNAETAKFHDRATLTGRIGSRDTEGYLVYDANNTNPNGLYGVCWGASENPTRGQGGATNYVEQTINNSNASTFDFSLEATGLTRNTAYHYRAYSINKEGNIAYGSDRTFTTRANSVVLTANPSQGGWVSGSYASLNNNNYSAVATANEGYTFTNWTEGSDIVSAEASYNFNVTSDRTLQANFTINSYTITVAANPTTYGSVTGGGAYDYGTVVNLVATPNTGYKFVNWTLNGEVVSGEDNYTITVTANANYVANFEPRNYVISVSANPENGGTITGGGTYAYNTAVTLTATANTGYTFTNWTENGTEVSTNPTYSFNATSDRDLVANFGRGRTTSHPRDIYPAPAREPWDWDDEDPEINRENEPPTVTTGTVTDLTATSATTRGMVTNEGDASVTAVGIWWSTKGPEYNATTNPGTFVTTTTPSPVVNTQFSIELTGLNGDATYYVRAYATNTHGTGFGNLRTFSFNCLPTVNHNSAKNGGGIYIADGGKILFSSGDINLNEASVNGGGIYLEEGSMMQMRNICEVNGNHTPDFNLIPTGNSTGKDSIVGGGAGIYLDGMLYLGENINDAKGTHRLVVDKNYAITNFDEAEYHNGAYNNDYYLRNNVFLPYSTDKTSDKYFDAYTDFSSNASLSELNSSTADNSKTRVIALLSDISNAENTAYSHIGFSVTKGKIPVVTTSKKKNTTNNFDFEEFGVYSYTVGEQTKTTEEWMNTITDRMNSAHAANASVFDDARAYIAIHAREDDDPFRNDFIYLWDCWTTPIVKYDPALYDMYGHALPETDDSHYTVDANGLWHIKDEKGLAWFSANVNRLNNSNNQNYSTLEAVLEADLDMTEYLWVPIASVRERQEGINTIFRDIDDSDSNVEKLGFRGKFNGQGHIIKGIDCRYISGMEKYGLFGNLEDGAVVENTFVDASSFRTNDYSKYYHVGGIAGLVEEGATIKASEARFVVDLARASRPDSYVGGIAGQVKGTANKPATIHSSMAMPEIKGAVRYVGGLVGQLGTNCDLLNSFANPKFPDAGYQDTCWVSCHYDETPSAWVADETAYNYFGGLVGVNNGKVENCYSRLQGNEPIGNVDWNNGNVNNNNKSIFGWLAGTNNNNNIKYCYAAIGKAPTTGGSLEPGIPGIANGGEYQRAGSGTISGHGTYSVTERYSNKYGFKHRDHQMTAVTPADAIYVTTKTNDTLIGGLQHTLNGWVKASGNGWNNGINSNGYAVWTRTMASPINDDYPVPVLTDFNAVGSEDSIYMHYKHNVDDLIDAYTKLDQSAHPTPSIYLYDTIRNGTSILPITKSNIGTTHPDVMLAINEDLGIKVSGAAASTGLKARVGVTIKNSRKVDDYTADPNWHLFSSAINTAPIGLDYHTSEDQTYCTNIVKASNQRYSHPETVWGVRTLFDPPKTTWFQSDIDSEHGGLSYNEDGSKIGYFPTNTPYGTWRDKTNQDETNLNVNGVGGFFDLYEYNEYYYHWINYKREGTDAIQDHWHMDGDAGLGENNQSHEHYRIGWDKSGDERYFNDVNMPDGKGYMMALSSESMMMADGTLNTGAGDGIKVNVTNTDIGANLPPHGQGTYNYTEPWRSLNLIGNPFQSYLDFGEFVKNENNGNILCSKTGTIGTENVRYYTYYTRDDDNKEYVSHTTTQSSNPELYTTSYIHPHQGFFVMVNQDGTLQFTESMRKAGTNTSLQSEFREEHLNYPLVNLFCYDASGERDFTTVEINRPSLGGGRKAQNLKNSKALVYARLEDTDYQILFAPVGINTVPVRFETEEDGVFTMKWNTLHGDFSYLHLIDNIAGVDVNCLTTDEYRFEGKTTDYLSRFKLVFECTGLEENEDTTSPEHFAFQFGDELVVNGEGLLQMFDTQGRCLLSTQAVGSQTNINLPKVAAGVYLLRLTGNNQVKVQKMVIK